MPPARPREAVRLRAQSLRVQTGCSGLTRSRLFRQLPDDNLTISIDRGWMASVSNLPSTSIVSTQVVVSYPYHWRFNSVIQLLVPGASYAA